MTYFPDVERWLLPMDAFKAALAEMAIDGTRGNEGIAMWLGCRRGGVAEVTHVAILRGPGVEKRPAFISLQPSIMNALTMAAIDSGVTVLGQIHSHGPWHGVSLSPTDRTMGIRVPGFLSLVAPDYAQRPAVGLEDCGVHVFDTLGGFRRMAWDEVRRRVQLTTAPIEHLVVTGPDE